MKIIREILTIATCLFFGIALSAQTPDCSVLDTMPHPRLLLSSQGMDALREQTVNPRSEAFAKLHTAQIDKAREYVSEGLTVRYAFDASGKRILTESRKALSRVFACAYAYRMTGERIFLDYARKVLSDVCGFPNWNPSHFLDTAEMGLAVAIGYDWLYDELSPSERSLLEETLIKFNLEPSLEPSADKWAEGTTNWNQVCHACCTAAAMAVYEHCPQTASKVIARAVRANAHAVDVIYSPDGVYPEGAGYWDYGTNFQILFNTLLTRAFGSDFGISSLSGFPKTAKFFMYSQGNVGKRFDYADTKSFAFTFRQAWYFADRFSDPGSLYLDLKEIASGRPLDMSERLSPLFLIYASRYDGTPVEQPSEKVYYGKSTIPIAVVRTGWEKNDIYLGIKGGRADYSHSHMDVGSFVYEAGGVRWASESHVKGGYPAIEKHLKPKGVSLFSYKPTSWRWKVFTYRPQEHNTLIINEKLHIPSGEGIFTEIIDEPLRKGAVIDITAVLGEDVASAVRTIEIVNDEYLRITDVITASDLGPVDVRFNIMSDANSMATKEGVILTSGNSVAILSASGAKVRYQTWSVNPADYPNDVNSYLSLEDGTSLCGYLYTVPSGKTRTVVTTLRVQQ